ncbi:nuclease-related domain-containing protein [Agromyces humi]|uniref:nuclease-related domain-containing protein n=1 Tax=Agromyces humi TaxID=1766800 RepID=UPI0013572B7F|nr:nuclease-related domain-containing protein [Agromyces humi]
MTGRVYGRAGGSLEHGTFAANADVAKRGADGERRTAKILDVLTRSGVAVFHDLNMPGTKYAANVDHVIVSGNHVTIVDSKVWQGAFYWTLGGATFRGLRRFSARTRDGKVSYPAEKRTLPMARDLLAEHLGISPSKIRLALIIWPTGPKPLSTVFFRPPGSPKVINGQTLSAVEAGVRFGRKPADPHLVSKLATLLR